MELGLKDKVVLVTGASKGIGRAIAAGFAAERSKVAITARGAEELRQAAQEIGKSTGAEVIAVAADMSKANDGESQIRCSGADYGSAAYLRPSSEFQSASPYLGLGANHSPERLLQTGLRIEALEKTAANGRA